MPELRDALREATNKLGILAGNPQLIAFDAMLTSYPTLTVAGAIGFGVNPANAFAGAAATIEVIANGANVPTFTGITATGSYVNTAGAVNRIEFECLPSGPGSALAFYAKIGNGGGAAPVTSVAGKTGAVLLVKADVGLGAVDNTADIDKPVSSAVQSAIDGRQPIDSDLTAIAALTTTGIIEKTGAGTAASIAPSASGRTVLTGDPAAARGAIGMGALATKNTADLSADISGNEYLTPATTLTLGQLGGPFGFAKLTLANQGGLNGAQFETSIPLVDFVFRGNAGLGYPIGGVANLRFEWRPDSVQLPGNTRECQIFFDTDPYNTSYIVVGNNAARIQPKLTLVNGLQIGSGATQTASLRGSKTIGTPSTTDTITVVGAAVGDIVSVSRGRDAFVSATNTVQFDSTGLGGVVVSAIVERFI